MNQKEQDLADKILDEALGADNTWSAISLSARHDLISQYVLLTSAYQSRAKAELYDIEACSIAQGLDYPSCDLCGEPL